MEKVIIVSYHFPPYGGKAVQRAVKLAKYLPEYGWKPLVFTMPLGERGVPLDPTLLHDLPADAEVYRPRYRNWWNLVPHDIRKHFYHPLPDRYRTWVNAVENELISLIDTAHPRALVSTSPTHSAQLIGLAAKEKTGIPWAADFRDPWTGHPDFAAKKGADLMRDMETRVLESADAVVGVYPKILRDFTSRVDPRRLHLVENGYDEDDFNMVDWDGKSLSGPLWIGYNGTVSNFHDPAPFLAPLESLYNSGGLDPDSLRIVFTTGSRSRGRFIPYRGLNEAGILVVNDYLPHAESIARLAEMDISLHLLTRGENIYPGKIFEYFYLGNPVLSLSTPGDDLDGLIRDTSSGSVVDYRNPQAVKDAVLALIEKKKRGELERFSRSKDSIAHYSRQRIAGRYAEILEKISGG